MFHRRLLLLLLAAAVVTATLGAATAKLAVGPEQARRQAAAEAALLKPDLIPTVRGRILDRHGRVLAEDEPAFDITVHYSVITGEWAYQNAWSDARRADRERWSELDADQREALIAEYQPKYDEQIEMLWQTLAEIGGKTREEIEDRRNRIIRRVHRIATGHTANRQRRLTKQLQEEVTWAEAAEPVLEQVQSHAMLDRIDEPTRTLIQGFIAEAQREQQDYLRNRGREAYQDARALQVWRQVGLQRPARRNYPFETMTVMLDTAHLPSTLRDRFDGQPTEITVEGVGMHTLGRLRPAWSGEFEARPFNVEHDLGGYMDGDRVGSSGIEAMMEDRLRGTRGRKILHLDSNTVEERPAMRGGDVRLSIDIQLQARMLAIMSPQVGLMETQPWHSRGAAESGRVGSPLNGAAVVLEVGSGEVLATASVPTMPLATLREDPDVLFDNQVDAPFRNRVIAQPYQPGSTVKPLMLAAVHAERKLGHGEIVDTPGHLWPNKPTVYRDWRFKRGGAAFGPIDGTEAVARSSNVFFGKMAQRLGPERLVAWYQQFGMGEPTDCGLPGEHGGNLPVGRAAGTHGWEFMGIGQGPISWTPLQAANAYATLARGGRFMRPTYLADHARPVIRDLGFSQQSLNRVFEGMRQSASESYGTTHHLSLLNREVIFNVDGVKVFSKSGTADAAALREAIDHDGDGLPDEWGRVLRDGDHSWVVAMVQPDGAASPTHVVVVVVEYAGSGGAVAGPIVNQILWALKQEGYLD